MALVAIAASAALPPLLENFEPGLCRQRLAGGHDAMFGHDRRAALMRILRRPVVPGAADRLRSTFSREQQQGHEAPNVINAIDQT